jgi:hypothetical protein
MFRRLGFLTIGGKEIIHKLKGT